jgi:hypothetical protein
MSYAMKLNHHVQCDMQISRENIPKICALQMTVHLTTQSCYKFTEVLDFRIRSERRWMCSIYALFISDVNGVLTESPWNADQRSILLLADW